jgi:hypothetical protein
MKNQRKFFDQLAMTLNIRKPEDWYSVTTKTIFQHGGTFIKSHYDSSVVKGKYLLYVTNDVALKAIYPEHSWNKFLVQWANVTNQRAFFDKLAVSLNVKSPEDWYKVNVKTVLQEGGYFVNKYYKGSLIRGKGICKQY